MSDLISRQDFDKCLEDAEKESVKNRKYVFASALNTIRGNLRSFPSAQPHDCTTCRYNSLPWYEEPCDSCTGGGESNHWKPTADVVEVVRCKDCKHYTSVTAQCDIRGKGLSLIRGEEDFCSRAERRTDGC